MSDIFGAGLNTSGCGRSTFLERVYAGIKAETFGLTGPDVDVKPSLMLEYTLSSLGSTFNMLIKKNGKHYT